MRAHDHGPGRRGSAPRLVRAAASLVVALGVLSCNWISLAEQSLSYPTLTRGEVGNVAAFDSHFVATAGEDGFTVRDAAGATLATVAPAPGSESVDDIAIDGLLLFALDARPPGHLTTWSLRDPIHPIVVSRPIEVPVGPFSGVAAAAGSVIVSGGTSRLTMWSYDAGGMVRGPTATANLGRGQPDVLLARDGRIAYVSVHRWGPYFGLDVVPLRPDSQRVLSPLARVDLPGAGFTTGGARPANFPIESALLDDSTLLIATARGVVVVRVSDPGHVSVAATIDVGGPAVNVDANDRRAAVAVGGGAPAVALLDFSKDGRPAVRRLPLAPGTFPLGIAMSRGRIAVAARGQSVLVLTP